MLSILSVVDLIAISIQYHIFKLNIFVIFEDYLSFFGFFKSSTCYKINPHEVSSILPSNCEK